MKLPADRNSQRRRHAKAGNYGLERKNQPDRGTA